MWHSAAATRLLGKGLALAPVSLGYRLRRESDAQLLGGLAHVFLDNQSRLLSANSWRDARLHAFFRHDLSSEKAVIDARNVETAQDLVDLRRAADASRIEVAARKRIRCDRPTDRQHEDDEGPKGHAALLPDEQPQTSASPRLERQQSICCW